jgi:eukaryotic-like serine/threonine-protein kinase
MSDELLEEALERWEEEYRRGRDVPPEELCPGRPELLPALREHIEALKRVAWMERGEGGQASGAPPAGRAPTPPETPVPRLLAGRYRLDRLIAEGGFGQVWRGFDLELQRPVAVKLPRAAAAAGPGGAGGLPGEARRVACLRHPGIVAVHDVARGGGGCFIVSDLIDGADLGRHLLPGPFPARDALRIAAEVAEALHHAHQGGLVHRDIKPANILLDRRGRVFVTDFGIAATAEELRERGDDGCGTLPYMSPEQLFGDAGRVDHRTDVYSLGVVLYELLTGERPFQGSSPGALRKQILCREPSPPRAVNPAVPREAERICLRCLAKSPVNRYATAQELARDVRQLLSRLTRRRWRAGLFLGLTGLAVALGVYNFVRLYKDMVIYREVGRATSAREIEMALGMERMWERDYQRALDHIEAALSYWKTPSLLCVKANLLLKLRRYEEALACCDEVLQPESNRNYAKAHYLRGEALKGLDRLPEAREAFQRAADHGEGKANAEIDLIDEVLRQAGAKQGKQK